MTPVTFSNADGLRLFGILHEPERSSGSDAAVLLLSPGVKMRVAPHRLYNKMAERFVNQGYSVLRFDFHGLGDSEGEAPETYLADLYGATQVGRYVADTLAAMDWMQRTHGVSRFIAAGLCGGALTGLLAATRDPRIVGLLGLSIPVILDGTTVDAGRYMTQAQLTGTRAGYLRKLKPSDWRSWVRLMTFRSDYRMIARSLVKPLSERLRALMAREHSEVGSSNPPNDNTNPHFAAAFRGMLASSRPILLVFAEADRLFWEFETKFLKREAPALEPYRDLYQVHIVRRANHVFSFPEWQEEAMDHSCAWLARLASMQTVGEGQA